MSRISTDRLSVLKKNHTGRMSMLLNEDDYDYALELRPDDEYRQAAEALPRLVDFDDIDLSEVCKQSNDSRDRPIEAKENETIQPFSGMSGNVRRQSNFDQSMMELHVSGSHASSGRRSTTAGVDDAPSHWGGLDGVQHLNDQRISQTTEEGEEFDFEPSDEEGNEGQYDRRITGMGTNPQADADGTGINFNTTSGSSGSNSSSFSSKWRRLGKKEFSFRLNLLEKHKKWVERAARRSSIGFHRHHPSSDKEAMDKFLVAMAGGVHVRRHQAYRLSEVVRLYSVTGCRTIDWDKPKARDLLAQRRKQGVHAEGATNAVINTSYDKSAFDCCIAVCGCGDDLNAGHDPHAQSDAPNMYNENTQDDVRYNSFGRAFYNLGFRRRGTFRDLDVLAVHPAGKEDPTMVGMLGTECLRRTKDAFNTELTFSVVVRDTTSAQGYSTLDLECETADMYYLLLRGFRLLQEEAEVHRAQQRSSGASSGVDGAESDYDLEAGQRSSRNLTGGLLQAQRVEEVAALWNSVKGYITGGAWEQNKPASDPISDLFAPSSQLDPLRALRVGGGLLSANATPSRGPASGAINSPASPQSPSLLPDPHAVQTNSLPLAQFLGWNSAGTQIWARLKMAGLDVKCVLSWDLKRVILKIRCPMWRLEQMAEQMHLKLKTRDGYLKQFKVSRRDTFVAMGDKGAMFRSSERQQIIDYIIRSKIKDGGAELDENTELGKQIVQRFPLHMYSKLADIRHAWVTFWKREQPGQESVSWSPFTSPYAVTYNHLKSGISYFLANLLTQPLDSIAEYFGENIAFYFAYMAFYTRWLVFPSVLGVFVFAFQLADGTLDHWMCPIYAVIVMIWACFMLAFWRQKASALAHRWGVLDYEVEETERPQFRGSYTYDESSGEVRKTYSLWKRTAKYLVSIPVLSAAILVTLVIMTTVFYSQDRMYTDYLAGREVDFRPKFPSFAPSRGGDSSTTDTTGGGGANTNDGGDDGRDGSFTLAELQNSSFWAATFFYPCMYGIVVSLLTILFELIALWLNDFENHRTQTTYMNRLILKVFSFQFVTIFTSLYYYAFFTHDHEGSFYQISVTIFSLMTVGQWWSMFLDIVVPSLYHRALLYRMRSALANTNRKIYRAREYTDRKAHRAEQRAAAASSAAGGRGRNISRTLTAVLNEKLDKRTQYLEQAKSKCWEEALQARYNNFADYTSMVIQIGFVLFFSAVFPLCPLLALLNNIALIRFNALKICYTRQRPIAQKIGGIGVWEDVLQIMSVGGILTNCALYGFTSSVLRDAVIPSMGKTGMAILLFAYEHAVLLFKYGLHSSIPTIHPSVQRARTRERKSCDRKSMLRSQAAKARRRSTLANAVSGGGDDGGGKNGDGAAGQGGKKPLRAHSSLTGFWFAMSGAAAEDAGNESGVEMTGQVQTGAGGDEQETAGLLSASYGVAGEGKSDCDSDEAEWVEDYDRHPPAVAESEAWEESSEVDDMPPPITSYHPRGSVARRLLAEGSASEEECAAPLAQGKRSVSPQPQRASPIPSPVNVTASQRRSLSPTRAPSRSPSPLPPPSPVPMSLPAPLPVHMPVTRDEMISMIHANISNSLQANALVRPLAVPLVPSRRVSFVDNSMPVVTTQPTTPTPYGDEVEDEDEGYSYFDDEVSDLSNEDSDGDDDDQQAPGRYNQLGNLAPLSAGLHQKQKQVTAQSERQRSQRVQKDAWRMSFGDARPDDGPQRQQSQRSSTKYSPLQLQQQQHSKKSSKETAPAKPPKLVTAKSVSSKKVPAVPSPAPAPAPAAPAASAAPAVGGVQGMLSSWFWPSAAANKSADKATASSSRHNALNIAPLGQNQKSTAAKSDVKSPAFIPASPPPARKFEEVTSPYAALLTPPVVIATPSKQPTPAHVPQQPPQPQQSRDASPRRAGTPGVSSPPPAPTAAPYESPVRGKKGAKTTTPLPGSEQIASPFSYTGYTPDAPSSRKKPEPTTSVNQENDRILANLQTGRLQQLLLLQQQQQMQQQPRTPPRSNKRSAPSTAAAEGSPAPPTPASAGNSPSRSALAGSRKRQQQMLASQMQALGWQPSPNPYQHLISPSDAMQTSEPHPAMVETPASTGRRRSVLKPSSAGPAQVADGTTPKRRAPGSARRTSQAHIPSNTPSAAGGMAGAVDVNNPFSFATSSKRPARLQYD